MATPTGVLFSDPRVKPLSVNGTFQAGCQAFFYLTGTLDPTNVYADGFLSVPLTQPVTADSSGRFASFYLDPDVIYRVLMYTAGIVGSTAVQITDTDPVVPSSIASLTGALIGSFIYPISAGEIAGNITPSNYLYPVGDIRRYGGKCDSGLTDNTFPFQNACTASAGYNDVIFPGVPGASYVLTGRVTAPAATTIELKNATVAWSQTALVGSQFPAGTGGSASRPGLEVLGGQFRLKGTGQFVGPSGGAVRGAGGVFVQNEFGIFAQGGSLAGAFSGFYIDESIRFTGWGRSGVGLQYVNDVYINGAKADDCGYKGFELLCCSRGAVTECRAGNISPGASGNAYGFSFTTDSANLNIANSWVGRADPTPFCSGFEVSGNVAYDIPLWSGIDFHGGYDSNVHDNRTYNCCKGVTAGSSPDAQNKVRGGEFMKINDNMIFIDSENGQLTSVTGARVGILLDGGVDTHSLGYECHDNTISGYGSGSGSGPPTAYVISAQYNDNVSVQANTVLNWQGYGIYLQTTDGVVHDNQFGPVTALMTGSACIYSTISDTVSIRGNRHRIVSGTPAHYGAFIQTSADLPYALSDNDFFSADVAQYGQSGSDLLGTQFYGNADKEPDVVVTGSPTTFDVSSRGVAPIVQANLATSGDSTLASITGSFIGQVIRLHGSTGHSTTVASNSVFKLDGGASCVLTANCTLMLLCSSLAGGGVFIELSRAINS